MLLSAVFMDWAEIRDVHGVASEGGRLVLGWALGILALLWTGYTAWSAGRVLANEPLTSPAIAQWVAILTGPLALMGLVWLMFGRTRRKEAEKFTRSVIAMRKEARSLQDILAALSHQIGENHRTLGVMPISPDPPSARNSSSSPGVILISASFAGPRGQQRQSPDGKVGLDHIKNVRMLVEQDGEAAS